MMPIKRSRRLQAGLAGLSVLSAVGAAVGLGLTTHTQNSAQPGTAGINGIGTAQQSYQVSGERDDDDGGQSSGRFLLQGSPVTQPGSGIPQATTSGS